MTAGEDLTGTSPSPRSSRVMNVDPGARPGESLPLTSTPPPGDAVAAGVIPALPSDGVAELLWF
jgi:hypothetical protein